MRGDLQASLRELFSLRERGEVSQFGRVVIEASGLADPAPIAYTILTEPVIQHHFRLSNIVTLVDAVNGLHQLESFTETSKQVALADRLVISKTDLVDTATIDQLSLKLQQMNPAAPVSAGATETLDVTTLLLEIFTTLAPGPAKPGAGQRPGPPLLPVICNTSTPTGSSHSAYALMSHWIGQHSGSG